MKEGHLSGRPAHVVFSIATNGYEKHFAKCIQSQRDYCRRLNVPYCLIEGRPPWGINAHDSAWLKIPTLGNLANRVSGGVLYLDADCEVLPDAPDFRDWDETAPAKSVFACRDFSDRLNAAVVYCRSTNEGRRLLRHLSWSAFIPSFWLPRSDRNLYENGHFIWLLKASPHLEVMPQEWNSGLYRDRAKPFIIHYGGTEMRESKGETPLSLSARVHAAFVALRLPWHMAYFRSCLEIPNLELVTLSHT
jgi:hypothetical protein